MSENKPAQGQRYVRKNGKGVEVKAGQTWHDLTPEQRRAYFNKHEQQWKDQNSSSNISHKLTRG